MPVVFRYQGYKFFFYSNEGNPLEPAHIHVRLAGKEAKFWLSTRTVKPGPSGRGYKVLTAVAVMALVLRI